MKKNDVYSGFIVKDTGYVEEVDSNVYVLQHEKSGARLLYLANSDDNKVFSISFRTPPNDDTGLPHILEHSVLCGSRKYPLKEPFVELVKGSLNTFLNAMTFSDKTMYPVASRNDKDFRNLMDVYLDAVFYPKIYENKYILQQEGWHYELLSEDSPLEYKGVVYNEMKGVFSSPDSTLEYETMQALFPDTTYGFESGGFPEAIPQLTQEQFESFHKEYYHPANSYIFLYGDLDIEDTLAFIDKEYLGNFAKIAVNSTIDNQNALLRTADVKAYYPLASEESTQDKTFLSWNVVIGDSLQVEQNFAFQLLEHYLLETSAAPLKKALIKAGVAKEISGSFSNSMKQPLFTIRASGAEPENKEKFVSVIYNTLQEITMQGIDKELLTASLNRMEFHLREADFGSYPKGLVYAIQAMDSWLYDGEPTLYLRYNDVLKNLRAKIDERYYEGLIENYLLDNTHRAVVTLVPKQGLQEEKEKQLSEKLAKIKESFTVEELKECVENTATLLELQTRLDDPETLAKIPLLERKDIKEQAEKVSYKLEAKENIEYLYLNKFTNKIAYVNVCFDAKKIPEELVLYAYLLKDLLGKIDTKNYTYAELSKKINMDTGGIGLSLRNYSSTVNADLYQPKFILSGKALVRNVSQLCDLMGEIVNSLYEDTDRLQELIEETKATWDTEFFARGQNVVIARLLSYYSAAGKYSEQGLLSYYRFLAKLIKTDLQEIKEKLIQTAKVVFAKDNLLVTYCCDDEDKNVVQKEVEKIFNLLPSGVGVEQKYVFTQDVKNEGIITSAQVQYVGAGGNFRKSGFQYTGNMKVLENIMRYDYLWNRIRVKGGAYGANAKFDYNGNTLFTSYRDPNLADTLAVFKEIPEYLQEFAPGEREMTKYVIGTISQLDRPLTPSLQLEQATEYYLRSITNEMIQQERNDVIASNVEEIKKLAEPIKALLADGYICVLGGEGKIKADKDVFSSIVLAVSDEDK